MECVSVHIVAIAAVVSALKCVADRGIIPLKTPKFQCSSTDSATTCCSCHLYQSHETYWTCFNWQSWTFVCLFSAPPGGEVWEANMAEAVEDRVEGKTLLYRWPRQ